MWVIVHSPFGKALQAIRDNETRAEFVGVQVWHYRWVAFLVSGVYTGLAGALWVPLNGLTTPDILHWTFSGEIVFFTVLGGFRTFAGPIVGAIVFNYLEDLRGRATRSTGRCCSASCWSCLVLALPTGIVGTAGAPRRRDSGGGARDVSLLETEQLTKYFGDTHAVDHVDFTVHGGRGARPHRLERRGQDHAGQPDQRAHPGRLRPDRLPGRRHHGASPSTRRSRRASREASSSSTSSTSSRTLDNVALAIFSRDGKTRKLFVAGGVRHRGAGRGARRSCSSSGSRPRRAMLAGGLSQGERKLLDVAVAYALRPKLLFLDEPTSGVSTREKAPIMDIITSVVRSGGITAVIIEHDMDVVFTYCPRIVAMHQGAILADGTPDEIRNNEQVTANLLGTQSTREERRAAAMLEVERINTFRGPAHVLRDVSLTVGDGESVCLVGRNGAGKTTTIDSIMGLLPVRQRHGHLQRRGHHAAAHARAGALRASATRPRTPGSSPT